MNQRFELQCRETMDIGTKHLGQALRRFEVLKAVEIGAKQYDKEAPRNVTKIKRTNMGLPVVTRKAMDAG